MNKAIMDLESLKSSRAPHPLTPLPIPTTELCARYEALSTPMVNDVLWSIVFVCVALVKFERVEY